MKKNCEKSIVSFIQLGRKSSRPSMFDKDHYGDSFSTQIFSENQLHVSDRYKGGRGLLRSTHAQLFRRLVPIKTQMVPPWVACLAASAAEDQRDSFESENCQQQNCIPCWPCLCKRMHPYQVCVFLALWPVSLTSNEETRSHLRIGSYRVRNNFME